MNIYTVLGSIPVEDVRLADAHAHVWVEPPAGVAAEARVFLNQYDEILAELKDYGSAGGALLVDCQPGGCGRDGAKLAQLSRESNVHITAVTGFHLQKYYARDHWLWTASAELATAYFVEELTISLREMDVHTRAAAVHIAFEGRLDGQVRVLIEAAVEASRWTGAPLVCSTEDGRGIEELVAFVIARGVSAERLYLCRMDRRPDFDLHSDLARQGILLGYDSFARPRYDPESHVWPLLWRMLEAGLGKHIALGLDLGQFSLWRASGGPGLHMLVEHIIPRLRAGGASDAVIASLCARNIAQRLAFSPPKLSKKDFA